MAFKLHEQFRFADNLVLGGERHWHGERRVFHFRGSWNHGELCALTYTGEIQFRSKTCKGVETCLLATMAVNPHDMDGFMPLLSTTDIKKKLNVGSLLLNYLGDATKSIECQDIGQFIDNIIPWLSNGNPKVTNLFYILSFYALILFRHPCRWFIKTKKKDCILSS